MAVVKEDIIAQLEKNRAQVIVGGCPAPHREVIQDIIKDTQALMYPNVFHDERGDEVLLATLQHNLQNEIAYALASGDAPAGQTGELDLPKEEAQARATEVTDEILHLLPDLLLKLNKDIQAIYDGDPAATSYKEIVLCYPGYFAIFCYRLAHELYIRNIPIIPRVITEFAHQKTGVDINPGATIGDFFCIDHATGIVIGETAVLGDHVKLYQGVTIGAKSFEKDENGNPVKGGKRHPNIGNNVVIYANATILGGDTTIADGCTVGSNTWITKSTEPNTLVV